MENIHPIRGVKTWKKKETIIKLGENSQTDVDISTYHSLRGDACHSTGIVFKVWFIAWFVWKLRKKNANRRLSKVHLGSQYLLDRW